MITIIGVGALGSHVALLLRNMKHGLRVIDFDRVEQKNTQAQFHSKMAVGRNKAEALRQAFQGLFGISIEAVSHKLTADNATILTRAELTIDCTDNFVARQIIREQCLKDQTPCLHGSLSADGTFARIMWAEDFVPDAEGADGEATCIDGEHLPFFAAAAAYLAIEAQQFLKTGKKRSFQLTPAGVVRLR